MHEPPAPAPPRTSLAGTDGQFRILVDGVVDYALFMLDPDGNVASWNVGAERAKGYREAEIVGRHFSTFYTEEDRAAAEPAYALATAREHGRYEKEGWRVRKDGTRFWASVVLDAIRDDRGVLIGFAKVTRDITERRQAQLAVEAAQQAMLEAQKMEAIGQLTYGVAHDFNNLLTVITNSLDLIAIDGADPQRRRQLVDGAQRAAERGEQLTRQLLSFSRRQPMAADAHDLNTLIYRSEAMLRRACGEAFDIDFSLASGLGPVKVDVAAFEAALLNLLVNARDSMPTGGRIAVSTRQREVAGHDNAAVQQLGLHRSGRYVCVSVKDAGTGMVAEVRARALEPFFTTKDVGKGSGLGLSQVYGFASQSGGFVEIDSVPGQGTCVSFCLPMMEGASEAAGTVAPPLKILMVEDEADLQLVVVQALRHMGYAVLTAGDAPAALEILARDPDIDILFTDVIMPKHTNGIELSRQAQVMRPGLRTLLASGYALEQLPEIPENTAFIPKPYRFQELQARLQQLMAS